MTPLPILGDEAADLQLRIGDLAKHVGKSTRAVRLYEEMGLLGPVVRTDGGHRIYDQQALTRLTWIEKLHQLGFSLPKISGLLSELEDAGRGPKAMDQLRKIYRDKIEETRSQIRKLETLARELEDSLRYLDTCTTACDPSTERDACSCCAQPHSVAPPTLVAGAYTQRK